jgi:hypothetical protein
MVITATASPFNHPGVYQLPFFKSWHCSETFVYIDSARVNGVTYGFQPEIHDQAFMTHAGGRAVGVSFFGDLRNASRPSGVKD